MKSVQIAEMKRTLVDVLRDSQSEDVVITRYGRPVTILRGVDGQSMIDVAQSESDDEVPRPKRRSK